MVGRAFVNLLQHLASQGRDVLFINPKDHRHLAEHGVRCFDVMVNEDFLRLGIIGYVRSEQLVDRPVASSRVEIYKGVPVGHVVAPPGPDWLGLDTIAATFPDVPEDLRRFIFPKPWEPLSARARATLLRAAQGEVWLHPRSVVLPILLKRGLLEQVGPAHWRATVRGRDVVGVYPTVWEHLLAD